MECLFSTIQLIAFGGNFAIWQLQVKKNPGYYSYLPIRKAKMSAFSALKKKKNFVSLKSYIYLFLYSLL